MTKYAYLFYHRCDDNMFETCIKTLRKVSDCKIVVATDNVPDEMKKDLSIKYQVQWIDVPRSEVVGRRAFCKIKVLRDFVNTLPSGDIVMAPDVDMYFMADPFTALDGRSFDIGFTTRGYDYYFPINGGMIYIVVNGKTCGWLTWHVTEALNPKWGLYKNRNYRHRQRFGLDWAVGQDFLIACWERREWIKATMGVVIEDVGSRYNYCPPSDRWFKRAFECIREAYQNKTHAVLHLKGALKDILYEGLFEDAITKYSRCSHDWFGAGKKT